MTLWDQTTDEAREKIARRAIDGLVTVAVPHHFRHGLMLYISDGVLPGGFLQACLCNDLLEAVTRAGPGSVHAFVPLVEFLRWHAPGQAWGSREKVLAWTTTPERLEIR